MPAKGINHTPIPLPEFQKDKERSDRNERDGRDNRSGTPNDTSSHDDSKRNDSGNNFRHLTQIEGKNFPRKSASGGGKQSDRDNRDRERGDGRSQNGQFSRHFQNDLPPRFLKNQQRNNSQNNLQQAGMQQPAQHFGQWSAPQSGGVAPPNAAKSSPGINRNARDSPDRTRDEDDRR